MSGQHHSAQLESTSPSFTKGLSRPATTFSQSGQLPANRSSSSLRNFSAFFSTSSAFRFPLDPMPGIQPTGAVTMLARVSGMIKSRNLSPAESRFLPSEFVVRPLPLGAVGTPKFVDRSVRCDRVCDPCPGICPVPFTNSVCSAKILRNDAGARYSLVYTRLSTHATRQK